MFSTADQIFWKWKISRITVMFLKASITNRKKIYTFFISFSTLPSTFLYLCWINFFRRKINSEIKLVNSVCKLFAPVTHEIWPRLVSFFEKLCRFKFCSGQPKCNFDSSRFFKKGRETTKIFLSNKKNLILQFFEFFPPRQQFILGNKKDESLQKCFC